MAIRFSELPVSLMTNKCYEYMCKNYVRGLESWQCESVIKYGSLQDLKQVLAFGAAVQRVDNIRLAFTVAHTLPHTILQYTRHRTLVFTELLAKINAISKSPVGNAGNGVPKPFKCDAARLKNILSYLLNFHQIQLFSLPFSGLSILTADALDRDASLDWIFSISDQIEVMRIG
jgi:hypothetical protein